MADAFQEGESAGAEKPVGEDYYDSLAESAADEQAAEVVEEDPELQALRKVLDQEKKKSKALEEHKRKLEEETKKMQELQKELQSASRKLNSEEADSRSVHVGCVDYSVEASELRGHFESCGEILRITILYDKYTNQPKGFAYVEFADKSSVARALNLNDSILKGRALKVSAKRTNIPGLSKTRHAHRGGYGAYGYPPYYFRGRGRGQMRGIRGRGKGFCPY
ncbi:uncharacterized protein LOC126305004 [Schistocerca gregaria]|uniref:uncharacterized protein LOC126305004 n=1 Tax=Schistocerca gregaria TaxID=7010 RepID=UPI00211DA5A5|nr:uncharacterized protein LOC126305004 [Schistocerca gregaria]